MPFRMSPAAPRSPPSSQSASYKRLWWTIAAAVALYFFAGPKISKPSYQPSTYTPYQPSTPPTYKPSTPPSYQPTTRTAPLPPDVPTPAPAPSPQSSASSNTFSDHGPGRIACEGQWIASHRNDYDKAASGYRDFMTNCMKNRVQ